MALSPNPIRKSLLASVAAAICVGSCVLAAEDHAAPKDAKPAATLPPLTLQFEADERHYTLIAWLHWIGDRDPQELAGARFPEEEMLEKHLAARELPEEMRKRHRQAYESFLPECDLYVKNGLLISASMGYGQPPAFDAPPLSSLEPSEQARCELSLAGLPPVELPPAKLMAEFYERATLHDLWERHMKQAHVQALEHYRVRAETIAQETYAFLKVPIDAPVSLCVNLLGNFGILGNTIYSPWERRYLIKLHFTAMRPGAEKSEVDYFEANYVRVVRHELCHALLNDSVRKQQHLLAKSLAEMGQALQLDWMQGAHATETAPEWVADCMGYLDLEVPLHENVACYNRNPLYLHFVEKLPAFRASGKSFAEFLPELFASFDAKKEIARWKDLLAKKKDAGEVRAGE
ncbi:MAG: hypothetical protein L0Z55_00510 [Planctomycetes bacterium]|nr:hypothetical protein [Planctomycetota bacterium]